MRLQKKWGLMQPPSPPPGLCRVKKIDDYENSVNTLYLIITHASGYIEEKGVNKYLVNKELKINK